MLIRKDVQSWDCNYVCKWLEEHCEAKKLLNKTLLHEQDIDGRKLLSLSPCDLAKFGITKVGHQEYILGAIDELRYKDSSADHETLQFVILRLSCQSRSLQKQIAHEKLAALNNNSSGSCSPLTDNREPEHMSTSNSNINNTSNSNINNNTNNISSKDQTIVLTRHDLLNCGKQRVSLDTLAHVSEIASTVDFIVRVINHESFKSCRYLKSLLLALSIEMTSTAQRDQFVERPNDVLERCCRTLADHCDRAVLIINEPSFFEPVFNFLPS